MKITYLFGAGASRGCLPTVVEFPDRLHQQSEFLKKDIYTLDESYFKDITQITKAQAKEQLLIDMDWLYSECLKHASVDTLAKKLWLKRDWSNLERLKYALTAFLIIEQLRHPPDKRYDTFFASILRKDISSFPPKVNVVTWNYDFQFEISFDEYSGNDNIYNTYFPIVSKHTKKNAKPDEFALYKLNGTTEFDHLHRQYTFVNSFRKGPEPSSIEEVIRSYAMGRFAYRHLHLCLSFAWEEESPDDSIVSKTIEAVRESNVLVVIGYSFPLFNRDIDRKIIDAMTSLEKIYIQAPDADAMAERFEAVRKAGKKVEIVLKRDTGQFVFPNEL